MQGDFALNPFCGFYFYFCLQIAPSPFRKMMYREDEGLLTALEPPEIQRLLPSPQAPKSPRPDRWRAWKVLGGTALIFFMALQWADVVEWTEGSFRLKPKRQAEFEKKKKELENAEQYALVAYAPGYYECLHCITGVVFLNQFEVWKYGVTNQGEKARYSADYLKSRRLAYYTQFTGHYAECLIEEKRKLFYYPLLPENLVRPDSLKLLLPPGNLQTR